MSGAPRPRVLMLSKACIVGIYQRKLELIAAGGVDLLALVPPSWRDERGETVLERVYTAGYRLETLPIARNGDYHLHYYPDLARRIRAFQPHIVHIDEEPYNAAAWQALHLARRAGAKTLFFSWQNILRRYPPPFSWGERCVLKHADAAICGTEGAAAVWRAKGFARPIAVIPQFGTEPRLFAPAPRPARPFTVGYFGRMVEEKGVLVLLEAFAMLAGAPRLILLGGGVLRGALQRRAEQLGITDRVEWRDQVASVRMPSQYHDIDALVLPSLTRPNWKEQFGRVLVEAMFSSVPVIGSDSGAIPDVIGDAGLIVPEGDAAALAAALRRLIDNADLRADLIARGLARAHARFTHERVAAETLAVYRRLMGESAGS
jgi:glycosyltransferase involved in cell wall biosynthesis